MRLLVSGGCKMGKSTLAQRLAALQGEKRVYIATMRPRDAEDDARVARHQAERMGWGFKTVECFTGIEALKGRFSSGTSLLLDSTTALLAEEMFGPGEIDESAARRVAEGLLSLVGESGNIVIVSDTIYSDAMTFGATTEAYRRGLAAIDRSLAARCDGVIEMVFGRPIVHKGAERVAGLVEKASGWVLDGPGAVHCAPGGQAVE